MSGFLSFIQSTWILFLVLAVFFAAGIAGFYVDKNTDILEIEKKKRILREKSMDLEQLKSEIKDKSLSLGGTMGLDGNHGNANSTNNQSPNADEDLSVPLNLS